MSIWSKLFVPDEHDRFQNALREYTAFMKALDAARRVRGSTPLVVEFRGVLKEVMDDTFRLRRCLGVMRWEFPQRGITRETAKNVNSAYAWPRKRYRQLLREFRGTKFAKELERTDRAFDRLRVAVNELYGPTTRFQRELSKIMAKCEVTPYTYEVKMSNSYVLRLLSGERRNPSRGVVMSLATAIETHSREFECRISAKELDRLVKSAGFRPPRRKWRPS